MASQEEIREERMKKLALLKEAGMDPYPITTRRDFEIREALSSFEILLKRKKKTRLAGRIQSIRGQGGIVFFTFDDGTGRIQGLIKKDDVKEKIFSLFSDTVDVGDFIEAGGVFTVTKRGEKTLAVSEWRMLSKSLRSLPDKWHGLADVEERFRRRYLDILMSSEVRGRFEVRSRLVSALRSYMDGMGFMEVETPILQPLAGGATARPFVTHHNALDTDLHLRIAPELYLKELLIAGMPKVYEIGRLFRNEGIDVTHNPEFTTIEFYEAFADAASHQSFLEKMIPAIVKEVTGKTAITYQGKKIDFGKKFARVPFADLMRRYAHIDNPIAVRTEELRLAAKQLGVVAAHAEPREKILDGIYKKACREKLIEPTYIIDYPLAFSPLAKKKENNQDLIDRYQLVVGGLEVLNAFSELNDPIDQRGRFLAQEKNRGSGDLEAQPFDEEYLEAMEYGLPPAGGVGLSIDRLSMLLTDTKNIREVIIFPTLRPRA
ncbi:lysine--tRNA ligase [bacterium]|nr:lysine--tRNA ligase [bacterium]